MDYYKVLGVSEEATEAEIKSAYRRLVKQHHPDTQPGRTADRFRQIQEAYETLSDPARRRAYDASRARVHAGYAGAVSWTGGYEDPLSVFREVFPRRRSQPPVHLDLVLSASEASKGGEAILEVPRDSRCPHCGGRGLDFFGWCMGCRGEGWLRLYERIRFPIPSGVGHGELVTGRLSDGTPIRARVRVR